MMIARYYPDKLSLARAWVAALEALPDVDKFSPGTVAGRQSQLSRPGKWEAREVPGVATFRPEGGGEFAQVQATWVETPGAIPFWS